MGGGIGVEALIVWGLEAGFDGVERVDEEVDCEGGEGAGEEDVGVGVVEGHWKGMMALSGEQTLYGSRSQKSLNFPNRLMTSFARVLQP